MKWSFHPDYLTNIEYAEKYRLTMEGGEEFIDEYLESFSARETTADFNVRRNISYCPAHAKAAVNEVKNSIFERLSDVTRVGGPKTYQEACVGEGAGVDGQGSSMDSYIGTKVLPELLMQGRVGIFVDREARSVSTLANPLRPPYLYVYVNEEILNWSYDQQNELQAVLLMRNVEVRDDYGLVESYKRSYRLCFRDDTGVYVQDDDDQPIRLDLPHIPFVIMEMSDSLLKDIADYQIALLNLASSDIGYTLKSNYPFYTEQYSPLSEYGDNKPAGTETTDIEAKPKQIEIGTATGRQYAKGLERPGFIAPPTDPLKASMAKQEAMISELRSLIQLALTNLKPQRLSADSKEKDQQGLEAGLAAIGLVLEYGEREVAKIWAQYYKGKPATIKYPDKYSLRTDADRQAEADKLIALLPTIPSLTYQKEIAKRIAALTLGNRATAAVFDAIIKEINSATIVAIDPEVLKSDHEAGFVSTETASQSRLYPKGEVDKAKKDHAERAMRIAAAQSAGSVDAAARGVDDLAVDDAKDEKTDSQDPTLAADAKKKVRE